MQKSILFLPMGNKGVASSRTRVHEVVDKLKKEKTGLKLHVCNGFFFGRKSRYLEFMLKAFFYNVLFVQKDVNIQMYKFVRFMKQRFGKKIIYDLDDPVWECFPAADKYIEITDYVFVENDFNAEHARQKNPNAKIWIALGPINLKHYLETQSLNLKQKSWKKNSKFVVGWIGSNPTSKNIHLIRKGLELAGKKLGKKILLKLMGASRQRVNHEFENLEVEYIDWSLEKEKNFFKEIDVGIMPVKNDTENKGKGGYKLLQYMAAGIPWIASNVGVNKMLSDNQKNGLLVAPENSPKEWSDKIVFMAKNPEKRRQMALNGSKFVERFSLEKYAEQIKKIFLEL